MANFFMDAFQPQRPSEDQRASGPPAADDASTPTAASEDVADPPANDVSMPADDFQSRTMDPPYTGLVSPPKAHPRWWTPLAVSAASWLSFMIASLLMAILGVWVVFGELSSQLLGSMETMTKVSASRWGLLIVVVLPQLALVMPSIVAGKLSPVPFRQRLGLVRGHWPVWAWFAAAAATPLVGLISSLVVGSFMEESENLKEMSRIFRNHGESGFLFPLAMMIGATPAICEEFLFRGYVQTRLVRSFHPLIGIFVASFLFAAFHMDLVHVIAVFPMGMFLGVISYRSGSLFPAMLGHFVNNVISVVLVVMAPEDATDVLAAPAIMISMSIILIGLVGMGGTIFSIAWFKPAADNTTTTGPIMARLVPDNEHPADRQPADRHSADARPSISSPPYGE
ncbi:CAAX amino terminal protease self- immunity [Rubripirellula lacrimiformis]|uniref:CAAX amino terminal protease self-immunity n=1 Tax=Rubripirellula lacrimiformis TaxID=1930273 RepID=A0A517NAA9_9BACT|nr:type II CAAX endopeptidase family protein [Rubripirellula lacrimiformis]QDT04065.1 CAAX amino terminal protease self- immunity [Rubripirellula lacrimiformis]